MPDISKIKAPDNTVYNLLSKKTKGVIRCETDSTSTATAFKVTVSGITELYDGLTLLIKNTKIASAYGCTLQVNDLAAKRIGRSNDGGNVTTHWARNSTYLFVYDATNTRWEMQQGYWADNNTWRGIKVDGTRILGTGISTGDINFVSGSNVTLTSSGNDLTISASGGGSEQVSYGTSVPLSSEGSDKDLYFKVSATSGTATVDIRVVHPEMDAKTVTLTITHGSNTLYTSTPTTNVYAVYNQISDTFLGDDGTSHTITHYGIRTSAPGQVCNSISIDGGTAIELICNETNSSWPWDLSAQTQISYVGGYDTVENGYLKAGDDWIPVMKDQVNADWNASSGVAQILNKPSLATVATSGSYSDLSGRPTIPTKTSDLTNNSGFITADSPSLTGTPTSVTPISGDDSTKIATTAYVQNELDDCVKYESGAVSIDFLSTLYLTLTGNVDIRSTAKDDILNDLGLTYSSITLSPESGATVETGGAYRLGPIVVFNVVLKLTKSFANGAKICGIPTQLTESRFMAYTGTDAWFAGKAMMPCRFHGSSLKPIGATPTASSTNPIYLYVNQTYITSAS